MPDWEVKRPLVAGAVGRNPYKTVKFRAKLSESRTRCLSPRILALLFSQFDCCVDGFSVHSQRMASAVSGLGVANFFRKGPGSRYFQLCRSQLLSSAIVALNEAAIGKMNECGCALVKLDL